MAVTARRLARVAQTGALVLGGLGVLALYLLVISRAPEFVANQDLLANAAPEQRLQAEHNARLIVISVGGALFVSAGLFYTARGYRLAHRGQVTERFTKALERLGASELYIRIGGVRALEHVMRDSREHHGDVVEVLVAFVRDRVLRTVDADGQAEAPTEPAPDVQAALTALGNRPIRAKRERDVLNLQQLHLRGARLDGARFKSADLREANLQDVDLRKANLQDADLWAANLQEADLDGADLRRARLNGEVNLQAANLGTAKLQHANLVRAELSQANLGRANLQHTQLGGANLEQTSWDQADLRHAYLGEANLQHAYLDGADLREADLRGANLSLATVTAAKLRQAVLSEKTILPEGLVRGPSGEIRERNLLLAPPASDTDQQKPTT